MSNIQKLLYDNILLNSNLCIFVAQNFGFDCYIRKHRFTYNDTIRFASFGYCVYTITSTSDSIGVEH